MTSRKREQKGPKGDALSAVLPEMEDDEILPAAVRFARELLGAKPNDVNVTLQHENIRRDRCFLQLRFPDGELREICFSKYHQVLLK